MKFSGKIKAKEFGLGYLLCAIPTVQAQAQRKKNKEENKKKEIKAQPADPIRGPNL